MEPKGIENFYPQKEGEDEASYYERLAPIAASELIPPEKDETTEQYRGKLTLFAASHKDKKELISEANQARENNDKQDIVEEFSNLPDLSYYSKELFAPERQTLFNLTALSLKDTVSARDPKNKSHMLSFAECRKEWRSSSPKDLEAIVNYYTNKIYYQNDGRPRFDEKRYEKADLDFIKKQRDRNKYNDSLRDDTSVGLRSAGANAEKTLFPLTEQGAFDLEKNLPPVELSGNNFEKLIMSNSFDNEVTDENMRASYIIPSEYDDYKNGTDFALTMPFKIKNKNTKEEAILQLPICFDATTSNMNPRVGEKSKIKTIVERFWGNRNNDGKYGLTSLKYPSTCFGKALPSVEDCPHFAIYLPRNIYDVIVDPYQVTKNSINRQIFEQSKLAYEYWIKNNNTKKALTFFIIAKNFQSKKINSNHEEYSEVLRYLAELKEKMAE